MNQDWLGVLFFAAIVAGALFGLRTLTRPSSRTAEEFERNAAEGTTMLGASMNALQKLMNPSAAKAKEVEMRMRERRFKKRDEPSEQ